MLMPQPCFVIIALCLPAWQACVWRPFEQRLALRLAQAHARRGPAQPLEPWAASPVHLGLILGPRMSQCHKAQMDNKKAKEPVELLKKKAAEASACLAGTKHGQEGENAWPACQEA